MKPETGNQTANNDLRLALVPMGGPCLDLAELLLGEGKREGRGTEGTAGVEELQVAGRVLTMSHPGFGARASPKVWARWIEGVAGASPPGTWRSRGGRKGSGTQAASSLLLLVWSEELGWALRVRVGREAPIAAAGLRPGPGPRSEAQWARSLSCTALRETHG